MKYLRTVPAVGNPGASPPGSAALLAILVLLFGTAAGLADPLLIGVILAPLGAFAMLLLPNALLWIVVLGGLVIAGTLEIYLPGLQVLRWAFAGASMLLFLSILLRDYLFARTAAAGPAMRLPALFHWALAFLVVCGVSTLLNWHGVGHALFGWKGYFQLWGLFLSLALARQTPPLFRRAPGLLLGIAFLQLPFVIQQFLVLAPARTGLPGIVPVDIVAGTFGGAVLGGGANSLLALYLLSVIAVLVSLWRSGAFVGSRWPLPAAGLLMLPLFLNESKASMVLLLVSFLIVFREDIRLRPMRFVGIALSIGVLLAALLYSYTLLSDRAGGRDPLDYLAHAIERNSGEGERFGAFELNRVTALEFWAEQRSRYGIKELLVGHGPGEAREQSGALDLASDNLASTRYAGMGIGVTSAAGLLWELGIAGACVVAALFVSAFRLAGRLAGRAKPGRERGWFTGLQAVVAMVALTMLHKDYFLFHFEYQTFLLLLLGYLVHVARRTQDGCDANSLAARSPRAMR